MMNRLRDFTSFDFYLFLISSIGGIIIILGVFNLPQDASIIDLLLLLFLIIAVQLSSTSIAISSKAGVAYTISPAISLAIMGLFGPLVAAIAETVSVLVMWLMKRTNGKIWQKNWWHLFFNAGMRAICVALAGIIYQIVKFFVPIPIWGDILAWLFAAIIYQQVNLWLLIGVLRLQQEQPVELLRIWSKNAWVVGTILLSMSGWLLTFVSMTYGRIGIIIFFFPISLPLLAFRLYAGEVQSQIDSLEGSIVERIKKLEEANQLLQELHDEKGSLLLEGNIVQRTKELEETNQSLRELNDKKDAYLAALTHDMKTPLASINLYGKLMADQPDFLQKKPEAAQSILSSQQTLLNIVNNILDLNKLELGQAASINKASFDLSQLIDEVVTIIQLQIAEKKINLSVKQAVSPLFIYADRQHMQRIITNLVSNAIKYTPNQGSIFIETFVEHNHINIAIRDTGYGIPEAELPYIFDRYHRVDKFKQKATGTGLGLAVTKALVEAHNGQVRVTSQEGIGSCFTVTLPTSNINHS